MTIDEILEKNHFFLFYKVIRTWMPSAVNPTKGKPRISWEYIFCAYDAEIKKELFPEILKMVRTVYDGANKFTIKFRLYDESNISFIYGPSIKSYKYFLEAEGEIPEKYHKEISDGIWRKIQNFSKEMPYMFTTEDGKKIYFNDSCICVRVGGYQPDWGYYEYFARYPDAYDNNYKYFSTKEVAEAYIKLHQNSHGS